MPASSKSWRAQVRKFLALNAADKLLLFACVPVVAATRLGLTLLSYNTLKRWLPDRAGARLASDEDVRRLAWSVRNAARVVPGASCLTQAMAAQFLLARSGRRSQIQLGVAKEPGGRVVAHAWLISNGHVVIGGSPGELQRYKFLAELDPGVQ